MLTKAILFKGTVAPNGVQIFMSNKDINKMVIPKTGAEARRLAASGYIPLSVALVTNETIQEDDKFLWIDWNGPRWIMDATIEDGEASWEPNDKRVVASDIKYPNLPLIPQEILEAIVGGQTIFDIKGESDTNGRFLPQMDKSGYCILTPEPKSSYSPDEVRALLMDLTSEVDDAYRMHTRNNFLGSELLDDFISRKMF